MPLQIRRGLEAERTQITPTNGLVEGELLYVTDEKKLYIGSGSTGEHQGVVITGYTNNDAKDAAAEIFTGGEHTGITFAYDDETKSISAIVDLSSYDGPIVANALKGSVFADDSSIFLDAIDKVLYGDVIGNITGDVTGNITGNVLGNLAGDVIGNITGDVIGNVTGNVLGNLTGDVVGSVFSDDSVIIIDGVTGTVNGSLLTAVTTPRVTIERDTITGFSLVIKSITSDEETSSGIQFQSSRGSIASPEDTGLNDRIFAMIGTVWKEDIEDYVLASAITSSIIGPYVPDSESAPSQINFFTSDGVRELFDPEFEMRFESSGVLSAPTVEARVALQLPVYADDTARDLAIPTPAAGMMILNGTAFQGFNGSAWVSL